MSRFRQLSTSPEAETDTDIKALMEDIDASLADLEKRLAEEQAALRGTTPVSIVDRTTEAPDRSTLPEVETGEPLLESEDGSGLLAELAQEAAVRLGSGADSALERQRRERRLHDVMGRIFKFFNAFCRHTNALLPAISRSYALDARIVYSGLAWKEASVRYRLQNLREKALMDYVATTVRLTAPSPVHVVRRWDQVEQFKKEMHLLDLRLVEDIEIEGRPQQENVEMDLAADFPIQLTFRANYRKDRVDLLARNLDGFGIGAYVCSSDDVTQQLLDDLGRFLLGRVQTLPPALQSVHVRSEL